MADLDTLIREVDALMQAKRAEYYARLQPGATEQQFSTTEHYYGFVLPETLKTLYHWKNGQDVQCHESFTGTDNLSFMSLEEGMHSHQVNEDLDKAGEFQPGWWDSAWVPFLANSAGDYVCMWAGPDGQDNGLLWYFHDYEERPEPDCYSVNVLLDEAIEYLRDL
jgi:cell wall assembly regulator SMI1